MGMALQRRESCAEIVANSFVKSFFNQIAQETALE